MRNLEVEPATIISIVATIIAFISLIFTWLRNKIIKEQLDLIRAETKRKSEFGEVARTVQTTSSAIDRSVEEIGYRIRNHPHFSALRDDIVRFLYDENRKDLELQLNTIRLDMRSVETGQISRYSRADSFEYFRVELKRMLDGKFRPRIWIYYDCDPDIRTNPERNILDASDLFEQLVTIYQSINRLSEYEPQISLFNNKIINEMQTALMDIFQTIYEYVMKSHKITIEKSAKSGTIRDKLIEEMMGLKQMEESLNILKNGTRQLSVVQKELFQASR